MLKTPRVGKKYFIGKVQNVTAISVQVSPASLLDISADNYQRALVNEKEIIRTQTETHNRL
jgi:hypothetical protein